MRVYVNSLACVSKLRIETFERKSSLLRSILLKRFLYLIKLSITLIANLVLRFEMRVYLL